jgi:hypothetical protein
MAAPIQPNTGQPVNFHTNVNRAKTKRWVEAKSYAYDGDDWGDGDEYEDEYEEPAPQPAPGQGLHAQPPLHVQTTNPNQPDPGQRQADLANRQAGQFGNRSFTNPAQMHNRGQPSFDQGEERRSFSTNVGGFEGPYPTTQRAPFSLRDQYPQSPQNDSRMGPPRGPPPLSSLQQGRRPSMDQEPSPRAPFVPDYRPGPYSDPRAGPYPGQMPQQGRRSQSSGRPSPGDIYGGRESPSRVIPSPLSAVSVGSRDGSPGKSFPLRKSSLSQQAGPAEFREQQSQTSRNQDLEHENALESPVETKPLPFIRPADIYKRMAEEKERERRASEESSKSNAEALESQKRPKPALDPVKERRSEYGMENMLKGSEPAPLGSLPARDDLITTQDDGQRQPLVEESTTTRASLQSDQPSSGASDTHDKAPDHNAGEEQNAGANRIAGGTGERVQVDSSLRHNPSDGFTSVVHQAFDDSQTKVPPTPSSVSGNSIVRSDSASASDISPIIERASTDSRTRPMSSSTITPTTFQNFPSEQSDPLPAPIRPGFRRESRTPSPGNSPARRPLSVATVDTPKEEVGIVSATTPTQDIPIRNAPSAIPRAESPTKGTVRDLAGRLETRSPASTPVRDPAPPADISRPPNERLESFRPSLPGGWNSYTNSTGTASPAQGGTPLQSTDNLPQQSAAALEPQVDDFPMAGPPRPREPGYETSGKAFEALAAAGSALSGAFATVTGMHQDDSSENEVSTEASSPDGTPARERFGGLSPVQEVVSSASNVPPSPPTKDAPYERSSSQQGYFPSPLRTSNTNEMSTPMRSQMLPALSTDNSPQDTESDRLRKEIVRSLTPKSAKGNSQLRSSAEAEPIPQAPFTEALNSSNVLQGGKSTPLGADDRKWDEAARKEDLQADGKHEPIRNVDEWPHTPSQTEEITDQSLESVADKSTRPLLQKRFSWEESAESVGTFSKPTEIPTTTSHAPQLSDPVISPQTIKAPAGVLDSEAPVKTEPGYDNFTGGGQARPTIMPVAKSNEDLQSDLPPPPVSKVVDEPRRSLDSESDHGPVNTHDSLAKLTTQSLTTTSTFDHPPEQPAMPSSPPAATSLARVIPFREILGMSTPQARIEAYSKSRHHLAAQESGLSNWLQSTGMQNPELQAVLNRNGRLGPQADNIYSHKPSPSRSKFPRIGTSLGGGSQQPHPEPADTSKPSFGSPSSGKLTSQQVQEEGKKLLQSAGKIGGKAGGAAKGLFAKGKNKFRASSGGGDKVDT